MLPPSGAAALGPGPAAGRPGHARAVFDRHLPAGVHRHRASLGATPVQMQQTLSAYLFGFAAMNLFHGALADSFGRRPVVLVGWPCSPGLGRLCAGDQHRRAGDSGGRAGPVGRGRHGGVAGVIRDMFPPAEAQRVMSQVTIYFGVAPAVAPMVGGWLFVHADWHSDLLAAGRVGVLLFAANWRCLPETLHRPRRQPFNRATCCAATGSWAPARASWRWPGQRRAVQRHVPVRAVGARVPRRTPGPGADAVLLVLHAVDRRHHGRRLDFGAARRPRQAAAPDPLRLPDDAGGVGAERGAEPAVHAALPVVGAAAGGAVLLRLGADGAGGHADGARPGARTPRHGVVAAGLHRQRGQRPGGRRDRAAGDAFHAVAGARR
jgi:MFS family permease